MKRLIITSFVLLAPAFAFAQHAPWSLADCISHALENNLTVKQSSLTVEQREVDLNTAQMSRLPNLSASANENLSFGRGLSEDNTYTKSIIHNLCNILQLHFDDFDIYVFFVSTHLFFLLFQ